MSHWIQFSPPACPQRPHSVSSEDEPESIGLRDRGRVSFCVLLPLPFPLPLALPLPRSLFLPQSTDTIVFCEAFPIPKALALLLPRSLFLPQSTDTIVFCEAFPIPKALHSR
ncbi:hypothetical protein ACOMHN_027674 [Nucella lapillus]